MSPIGLYALEALTPGVYRPLELSFLYDELVAPIIK